MKCENSELSVSVHRKPTHTDQYLNYEYNHQRSCKEIVITSLLNRAINVVSREEDRKEEMKHITKALIANGYNQHMIKKVEKKLIRRSSQENAPSPDQPLGTTILPYIPGTSEILCRKLKNHQYLHDLIHQL